MPAHPCCDVGHSPYPAVLKAQVVDVAEAVLVRDEVKTFPTASELWVDMFHVPEYRDRAHLTCLYFDHSELKTIVRQQLEVGAYASVAREGDGTAVW